MRPVAKVYIKMDEVIGGTAVKESDVFGLRLQPGGACVLEWAAGAGRPDLREEAEDYKEPEEELKEEDEEEEGEQASERAEQEEEMVEELQGGMTEDEALQVALAASARGDSVRGDSALAASAREQRQQGGQPGKPAPAADSEEDDPFADDDAIAAFEAERASLSPEDEVEPVS